MTTESEKEREAVVSRSIACRECGAEAGETCHDTPQGFGHARRMLDAFGALLPETPAIERGDHLKERG